MNDSGVQVSSPLGRFCHLVALHACILGDLGAVLEPLHLGRRHAVDLALEHHLRNVGRDCFDYSKVLL